MTWFLIGFLIGTFAGSALIYVKLYLPKAHDFDALVDANRRLHRP